MRALIALIAIIAVSAHPESVEFDHNDILKFLDGFVGVLNFEHDLDSTQKCINEIPVVIEKVKALIEKLKKINWQNLEEIISIIMELKDLIVSFVLEGPCIKAPTEFMNLAKKIDISGIINRLIANYQKLFEKAKELVRKLKEGWYHCAGKELAEILVIVFFKDKVEGEEDGDQLHDFVKGFLVGIGITGEIENIMKCIKNGGNIIERVKQAIEKLKHLDLRHIEDIKKAIQILVSAITDLLHMLEPCAKGSLVIIKLIKAIKNFNLMSIVMNLIKNAGRFVKDIADAIAGFSSGDYYKAGKAVGDIINKLFLGRTDE